MVLVLKQIRYFRKMRILILLIFTTPFCICGQTTLIDSKDADSLSIKEMKIHTSVVGDIGVTQYTIEIFNHSQRQLSGELQFPLSDHQTIVGYALDINGELREAVAVDKAKGRAAYETIVSRNIDPGLVEKTEGNNFKTRIYPIPAKGSRTIRLDVLDKLNWDNGNLLVDLTLDFKEKIAKKDIQIDFIGFTENLELSGVESFTTKKNKELISITSTTTKEVHIIATPKQKRFTFYQKHENDYFYYNSTPVPSIENENIVPKSITVLWDHSRSRKGLVDKEILFLKELCKRIATVDISIVLFNTEVTSIREIKVRNANTRKLERLLKDIAYDAATQYGCVDEIPKSDMYILCSDGLTNFGDITFKSAVSPLYTVTSQASNNPAKLKVIARDNGGVYLNLELQSITAALSVLMNNSVVFSGYKEKQLIEYYPKSNTRIDRSHFRSVVRGTELVTTSPVFDKYKKLNVSVTPLEIDHKIIDLKRFLAIEKVKELSLYPKENKEQLLSLGLKYHLLTEFTSLIVLETFEDYITNEIIPPNEEWQKQYADNLKLARLKKQLEKLEAFEDQMDALSELLIWRYPDQEDTLEETFDKKEKDLEKKYDRMDDEYDQIERYLDSIDALRLPKQLDPIIDQNFEESTAEDATITIKVIQQGDNYLVTGIVEDGLPLPGVNIFVEGQNIGTVSDFDGNFSLEVPPGSVLNYSFIGFDTVEKEVVIGDHSIIMPSSEAMLEEVVIAGFSEKKATYKDGNDFLVSAPNIDDYQIFGYKEQLFIKKKDNHIVLGSNPLVFVDYEVDDFANIEWEEGKGELNYLDWHEVFSLEIIPREASRQLAGTLGNDGIIFVYTKDFVEDQRITIPININKHIKHELSKKVWTDIPESLQKIKKYDPEKRYIKYLNLTAQEKQPAGFYMAAGSIFAQDAPDLAAKIWSNIAEIQLDNHENIRTLAYQLRSIGKYKESVPLFQKILEVRPDEPIAHRDLAVTYGLLKEYNKAAEILRNALDGNWIERNHDPYDYTEVMNTLYNDYHSILKKEKHTKKSKYIISGDLRVVLTWTSSDTDIDLHLITPSGKDFYYGNDESDNIRYNTDITDGYGPEEIIVKKAEKGRYTIMIDFFADRQQTIHGPVGLSIEMYKYFGTEKEERTEKVLTLTKKAKNIQGAIIKF